MKFPLGPQIDKAVSEVIEAGASDREDFEERLSDRYSGAQRQTGLRLALCLDEGAAFNRRHRPTAASAGALVSDGLTRLHTRGRPITFGIRTIFAMLLLIPAAPARAAFCSTNSSPLDPRHDFQFFAGYSPVSATLIGITTDRRLFLAGFGYSYRCWVWPGVSISYSGELMPAAVLVEPGQSVYGFAITPLGFTADFGRRRRMYPFLQTNEGIIASSQPVPINVIGATGLNFLIDVGGGVRIKTGQRHAISLGYKFLHISNGFTSAVNPGVDNNVFYAGFSILK